MNKLILTLILAATSSAFAERGERIFGLQFQQPAKSKVYVSKGKTCSQRFSGVYRGQCTGEARERTLEIQQEGCSSISIDGERRLIGSINSKTKISNEQVISSIESIRWNDAGDELEINYFAQQKFNGGILPLMMVASISLNPSGNVLSIGGRNPFGEIFECTYIKN